MDTTITSALMAGLRNALAANDRETTALYARLLEREARTPAAPVPFYGNTNVVGAIAAMCDAINAEAR